MWESKRTGTFVVAAALLLTACGGPARPETGPAGPSAVAPGAVDGNGPLVPTNLPTLPLPVPSNGSPVPPPPTDSSVRSEQYFGADVSWPQCPKGMGIPEKRSQGAPMPTAAAKFVIIGLTNGPSFTPNPCLRSQLKWVTDRSLMASAYSVVSYPDRRTLDLYGGTGPFTFTTKLGRLSNVGYQAAGFNLQTMASAQMTTPMIWIDVEPVPVFEWSKNRAANAAVVVGMARAYEDAGYKIGFYSTPALWQGVVGDLRFGAPEWRAAGQTSKAEALSRCGRDWSFQGGEALFGQWVEDGRDRNVTCPGVSRTVDEWFHQY